MTEYPRYERNMDLVSTKKVAIYRRGKKISYVKEVSSCLFKLAKVGDMFIKQIIFF